MNDSVKSSEKLNQRVPHMMQRVMIISSFMHLIINWFRNPMEGYSFLMQDAGNNNEMEKTQSKKKVSKVNGSQSLWRRLMLTNCWKRRVSKLAKFPMSSV